MRRREDRRSSRGRLTASCSIAEIEADATLVTNDGALLAGDIEGLGGESWI